MLVSQILVRTMENAFKLLMMDITASVKMDTPASTANQVSDTPTRLQLFWILEWYALSGDYIAITEAAFQATNFSVEFLKHHLEVTLQQVKRESKKNSISNLITTL